MDERKRGEGMRRIKQIVVHCTATPAGRPHRADEIRKWHKSQGWRDIGYHYVIGLDGLVEAGRSEEEAGAHVAGHNAETIGVCYVGGTDGGKGCDTRTPAQRKSLEKLLRELKGRYPKAEIVGHHDLNRRKECPCFDAKSEYSGL